MKFIQKAKADAQIAGRTTFHGRQCKTCGSTKRYSATSRCVRCANEAAKMWRRQNRANATMRVPRSVARQLVQETAGMTTPAVLELRNLLGGME